MSALRRDHATVRSRARCSHSFAVSSARAILCLCLRGCAQLLTGVSTCGGSCCRNPPEQLRRRPDSCPVSSSFRPEPVRCVTTNELCDALANQKLDIRGCRFAHETPSCMLAKLEHTIPSLQLWAMVRHGDSHPATLASIVSRSEDWETALESRASYTCQRPSYQKSHGRSQSWPLDAPQWPSSHRSFPPERVPVSAAVCPTWLPCVRSGLGSGDLH